MTAGGSDYTWLPAHQLHVALTLAHVDDLIARAGEILHDYLKPGPLELGKLVEGDREHVTVEGTGC